MKLPYYFDNRLEAELCAEYLDDKVANALTLYGTISVIDVHDFVRKFLNPLYDPYNHEENERLGFEKLSYKSLAIGWDKIDRPLIEVYRMRRWGYSEYYIELSDPKTIWDKS